MAKRVVFFIENKWAFGSIHYALCKELFKHNIYANLLDWNTPYRVDEMQMMNSCVDYFVTIPYAIRILHGDYGIPLEKIIAVAHGKSDFKDCDLGVYDKLYKYAVVCDWLVKTSAELGITRIPAVLPIGIHVENFLDSVHKNLNVVGYGGARELIGVDGLEIKRGKLVEQAVAAVDRRIQLVQSNFYHYIGMPGYYKTIDCLVMSSTEETVGLPAMEAAAAGRLVIGTPVGYFEWNGYRGGGIPVPLDANMFIDKVAEHLTYFRDNPKAYKEVCHSIQDYAKETYDWSMHIDHWVHLFE